MGLSQFIFLRLPFVFNAVSLSPQYRAWPRANTQRMSDNTPSPKHRWVCMPTGLRPVLEGSKGQVRGGYMVLQMLRHRLFTESQWGLPDRPFQV